MNEKRSNQSSNGNGRKKNSRSRRGGKNFSQKRTIPDTSRQAVKLIPLGGLEELGKNMWAIEQEGDILLIDMGVEMPGSEQPGVDCVIPNTQYLADKQDQIKGVIFTSPHPDNIGAAPYLMAMFPNLHIYTTESTFAVLESRHNFYSRDIEYKKHILKENACVRVGSFKVSTFPVGSNVQGTIGLCIYTMQGKIGYMGNFKADTTGETPKWLVNAKKTIGKDATILMLGSLGAEASGFAPTEASIAEEVFNICNNKDGKVFISTFPSMLGRLQQIVDAAESLDKHIFIEGKSILNTFNTARKKGYLQVKPGTFVGPTSLDEVPSNKLIVIIAGSSGDDIPHLMRMANREHSTFSLQEGDAVAYPSELIPGNERSVQKVNDNFAKLGAKIYHYRPLGTRHSAYARQGDLEMVYDTVPAKYVVPTNGPMYLLRQNADLAISKGYADRNAIVAKNGRVILFDYKQRKSTPETVPSYDVMVDGLGVGDLKDVVIRDRQLMSEDGILNLIVLIDSSNKKLLQDPDIVSKGFVDMEKSQRLVTEINTNARTIVEGILSDAQEINTSYIRDELRDQMGQFVYAKTERRPMVLPVVVII